MARRLTPAQQKTKLLAVLAKTDNISEACQAAKCTRNQFNEMVASGFISKVELQHAKEAYADRILSVWNKAGLDGIEEPVIRYNKAVPGQDGKPLMKRVIDFQATRQLTERLVALMQQQREAVAVDDIPGFYKVVIDARLLTSDELAKIKRIAQAVDDRRANRLLAQVDGLDTSISHSIDTDG